MKLSSFRPQNVSNAAGLLLGVLLTGCGSGGPAGAPGAVLSEADIGPALETMSANDLRADIEVLASDSFLGRGPGTLGGERTVDYLVERFRGIGLAPGNPNGTYVQDVPLVGVTSRESGSLAVGGSIFELRTPRNWVAVSYGVDEPEVRVEESELVFVGYGVQDRKSVV